MYTHAVHISINYSIYIFIYTVPRDPCVRVVGIYVLVLVAVYSSTIVATVCTEQ